MAVPRVFISSTYYDLKQVRNIVGTFISGLGYEPVMHERADVAYSQSVPLENDCYNEVTGCDIIVCIIGNHFGSQSSDNDLSITMNEVMTAIKEKKKVYIFISNDVYVENRTYIQNKDTGTFKSAYTDNIKIHEFIEELKNTVKDHVIESFDTTDEIVSTLRKQFAGLLQGLLQREASLTDKKTAYDLQQSSNDIQSAVKSFEETANRFFQKFDSTIYSTNYTLWTIEKHLGMKASSFYAKDLDGIDEFMDILAFIKNKVGDPNDEIRKYVRRINVKNSVKVQTLILRKELFDTNGTIKDIRNKDKLSSYILFNETIEMDEELPF